KELHASKEVRGDKIRIRREQWGEQQPKSFWEYGVPDITTGALSSIVRPIVNAANFELKLQFIQFISNDSFAGLANKCPVIHIASFLEKCDTIKINNGEGVGNRGFVAKHFWKEVTGRSDWVVDFTKGRRDKWLPMTIECFGGLFMERDHNTGSITMGILFGHALLDIRRMEKNYKWLVKHGDMNYEWFVNGEGKDANKVLYARLPCPATHLRNPNALLFTPSDSYSPVTTIVEPSAETSDLLLTKLMCHGIKVHF
ncbi:2-isopropylmalate synthase, partial [Bienertia sinuspersici]